MAGVVEWREIGGDSLDESEQTTYTRRYRAVVEAVPIGQVGPRAIDVRLDSRCPKRYQRDRQQPRGWVESVRVTRDATKIRVFEVEANYTQNLIEAEDEDPLQRPAEVSWKDAFRQVPATIDRDGNPIINKAGEYLAGQMVDESYFIARVEKNIRPGPASWLLDYSNTVNKDTVAIDGLKFDSGTLLFRGLSIGKVDTENDVQFRQAGFELWQNKNGWALELWNRGLTELVEEFVIVQSSNSPVSASTTVPKKSVISRRRILDDQGEPVKEPQFIDDQGRAFYDVGPDQVARLKQPLDPKDLVRLKFEIRGERKFKNLPLR